MKKEKALTIIQGIGTACSVGLLVCQVKRLTTQRNMSLGAILTETWCDFKVAAQRKLADKRGQGTTEYAILVGVLVVIAIIAITVFRPKIEELWNAIAEGINGL
jgi:Flp pilus assembly pilin Flp